ncbi:uncharacterized protein EAE97_007299 [Botrytis byssoidea]|uniref:Uncharacterized protein n=1 Tax=Botrytis byssoidea TaxID=139641 RepID=A0A9P5M1A3_9HELO|nr:uncharacterized protein EAE97_007299 [Botrytis byssoidea]KAF7939219.1 hypothetical protein EAE97_007299 [Botrytis byssoidea]
MIAGRTQIDDTRSSDPRHKLEIIVTDRGDIGLVSATAAIGDRIFLLRGGYMSSVLRGKEWKGEEREVEEQLEEGPPKQVTE